MRAMILAAGLGTRMEELTRDCPKPMLPLLEVPLIAHTLLLLYKHGCSFAAINTHYLGEQIQDFLKDFPFFPVQFSEEPILLGTGGGISRALRTTDLGDFFWVVNPDSIYLPQFSMQEIGSQYSSFCGASTGDPAPLLCLNHRPSQSTETGFSMISEGQDNPSSFSTAAFSSNGEFMYTGMALLHESQFEQIPYESPYHIVQDWRVRATKQSLIGYRYTGSLLDIGRKTDYLQIRNTASAFPLTYREELSQFMQTWKKLSC